MSASTPQPFSSRTVLAMLLFGALAFLLALYFIGAGETGRGTNDGGGHAGGKGLNGYAALSHLLERRGWQVDRSRSEAGLESADIVVLTPPLDADGHEIARIVEQRRQSGPTIIILPKWPALEVNGKAPGAKAGWVMLGDARSPDWEGFADDVTLAIGRGDGWAGVGMTGPPVRPQSVQWAISGAALVPVVIARDSPGHVLAAFIESAQDSSSYPLLLVFEPDLLNNMGMAKAANAVLADRLFAIMAQGNSRIIRFDLTLNGLGRTDNLLTLAFTPPFLAATVCLVLAAIIVAWRALQRFGPPLAEQPPIAFGKRQLVRNSAGLVLRTRRFHLLGRPYAALLRNRIARLLGLKRNGADGEIDRAIDAALSARGLGPDAFTTMAESLRRARGPNELLRAAQALKQLERMLET